MQAPDPIFPLTPEQLRQRELMLKELAMRQFRPSFTGEGDGYDYQGALAAGLRPTMDGHWPSVGNDGLILKGRQHPSFDKTIEAENARGDDVFQYKRDPANRWYTGKVTYDDAGQTMVDRHDGHGPQVVPELKPIWEEGLLGQGLNLHRAAQSVPGTMNSLAKVLADRSGLMPEGFVTSEDQGRVDKVKALGQGVVDSLARTVTLPQRVWSGEMQTRQFDPKTFSQQWNPEFLDQANEAGLNMLLGSSVVPEKLAIDAAREGGVLGANKVWYHGSGTGPVDPAKKWLDQPMYWTEERPMAEGYMRERGWEPGSQHLHTAELDESKFMDPEEYRALLTEKFPNDEWLDYHPSEAATVADPEMMRALKERGHTGVRGLYDFWMDDPQRESMVAAVTDPKAIKFLGANKTRDPIAAALALRNAPDKNLLGDNIQKYWAAVVDKRDGHIIQKIPYEKAAASDFHHSFYTSQKAQQAMADGDAILVWDNGPGLDTDAAFGRSWGGGPFTEEQKANVRAAVGRDRSTSLFSNKSDSPLFSAVSLAAERAPMDSATGPEWASYFWTPPYKKRVGLRGPDNRPTGEFKEVEVPGASPLPGVKPEELENLGVLDWLQSQPGQVSRDDLLRVLEERGLKLEERVLGGQEIPAARTLVRLTEWSPEMSGPGIIEPGSGLDDWIVLNDRGQSLGRVTGSYDRATAEEYVRTRPEFFRLNKNTEDARYEQYTTPGGENYQELLLKMPRQSWRDPKLPDNLVLKTKTRGADSIMGPGQEWWLETPEGQYVTASRSYKSAEDAWRSAAEVLDERRATFRSGHWPDDPNTVLHLRSKEYGDALHADEIQSDWHQEGREKGYKNPALEEALRARERAIDAERQQVLDQITAVPLEEEVANSPLHKRLVELSEEKSKVWKEYAKVRNASVPDAPLKKSWPALGLRRMLAEAARRGKKRLTWTTGETQAERYNLRKYVDRVEYDPHVSKLYVYDHEGAQVVSEHVLPEKLSDYVGREAAEALLREPDKRVTVTHEPGNSYGEWVTSDRGRVRHHETKAEAEAWADYVHRERAREPRVVRGVELETGGEGMMKFYDEMLVNEARKIARQYGAQEPRLGSIDTAPAGADLTQYGRDAAMQDVWEMGVTPEMRSMPLFSNRGNEALVAALLAHTQKDPVKWSKLAKELAYGKDLGKMLDDFANSSEKSLKEIAKVGNMDESKELAQLALKLKEAAKPKEAVKPQQKASKKTQQVTETSKDDAPNTYGKLGYWMQEVTKGKSDTEFGKGELTAAAHEAYLKNQFPYEWKWLEDNEFTPVVNPEDPSMIAFMDPDGELVTADDMMGFSPKHSTYADVIAEGHDQAIANAEKGKQLFAGLDEPKDKYDDLNWDDGPIEPGERLQVNPGNGPAKLYHGHNSDWQSFDLNKIKTYQNERAFFTTPSRDVAEEYGKFVKPLEADLSNAKIVDWGGGWYRTSKMQRILNEAREEGYDSVIIRNMNDDGGAHDQVAFLQPRGKVKHAETGDVVFANKAKEAGLVVALRDADGNVRTGKRGDTHAALFNFEDIATFEDDHNVGWATPDGKFLTREQAVNWLKLHDAMTHRKLASRKRGYELGSDEYFTIKDKEDRY